MSNLLLHIGYGKAASTFLQKEWLGKHPELKTWTFSLNTLDLCKLAWKNSNEKIKYYVLSDEKLSSWFPRFNEFDWDSNFQVKQYQSNICSTLKQIFPTAKILIITRGYEGFLKSMYSQYVKTGGELSLINFKYQYYQILKDLLDFDYLINLYIQTYGANNVIVIPYELLKENPEKFFNIIESTLGLNKFRANTNQYSNNSLSDLEMNYYPKISKVAKQLFKRIPEPYGSRLFKLHIKQIRQKRYQLFIKLLVSLMIIKTEESNKKKLNEFSNEVYELAGTAKVLNQFSLYSHYQSEYLL